MRPDVPMLILMVTVLLLSAVIDYRSRKIPNLITFPSILLTVFYYTITRGLDGLVFSTIGMLTGIGLMIIPFLLGGMGAGDAKLMGAVGAVFGAGQVFVAFLYTALLGGLYALLVLLVMRRQYGNMIQRRWLSIKTFFYTRQYIDIPPGEDEKPAPRLCYGIVIAAGTFLHMAMNAMGLQILML